MRLWPHFRQAVVNLAVARSAPGAMAVPEAREMLAEAAREKALEKADFKSVRGSFKFGNNHFPIQDQHIFEVAKDAKGRVSLKTIATPLKNHQDAYAADCKM